MATTIPLSCNICPKKPKFSDVSHLLTHVASKGHLSNYYKVKVRAAGDSGDPAARHIIDEYDRWYTAWGVEDLMSDRMNLKDKKRPRTRANASARGASAANGFKTENNPRTRTAASRLNTNTRSVPQRTSSLNAFDPRLVGPDVKSEPTGTPPLHCTAVPSTMQSMRRLAHAANGSPYLAARGDPFGYNPAFGAAAGRRDSLFETESTESPASYTYPEPPNVQRYTGLPAVAVSSPNLQAHSTPSRPSTPDRKDQDTSKLKGVLWPGMDIFDSATPTARRRRNQKKDASILEQLEASSLEVQPTEAIWLPDGALKKERVITGDVASSSSPWKSSPLRSDEERPPLAELPLRKPNFGRRRGQLGSLPYNTYADEVVEQRLNFPAIGKRKRTFPVYKDHDSDPEDNDEAQPRASLTRPAPMTYLTRGLGKENEPQTSMKQEQHPFAARFNGNVFERPNHNGDDAHQYRSTSHMDDYNSQSYTSSNNLLRLADVAATSAPFQTSTSIPNGYHNTPATPYGLGYGSSFMYPGHVSGFQQQYQYQMQNQPPTVHASSHMRSVSGTAGPMHSRSLSGGLHPLAMSQHHPFGAYGYGHGHSLHSMDQPSMFSNNNEIWAFGANGGLYDHGSRSVSGSAFDHPTPAPLSEPLVLSPVRLHDAEQSPLSPTANKVEDAIIASHHSEDHDLPIDDALSEGPSCGQPEQSEDDNRTITAPGTPLA